SYRCLHSRFLLIPSSFMQLDGENQCLKAAQDCGLYEKCGSLRSEYVLACTKRVAGTARCNQHKCHRALRRFLERVPEEYSLGVLFCPCSNTLCGERRRKTIVPSCSYRDPDGLPPNCLHQQSFCRREPPPLQVSHRLCSLCEQDAFTPGQTRSPKPLPAGPLNFLPPDRPRLPRSAGTIMTPNYVSNSSADVSLWCSCEGSGNQWQDCQRLQRLFTHNACLDGGKVSLLSGWPPPAAALTAGSQLCLLTRRRPARPAVHAVHASRRGGGGGRSPQAVAQSQQLSIWPPPVCPNTKALIDASALFP
uniref:GDNF family receptor alpha 3 n=1 Tax=Salarias fasciatus TaxID=181472 RepID=A0A672FDB6_SALFA